MLKPYQGYTAEIKIDTEVGVFHGRVLGIKDVITFEGETPREIEKEFHESIDIYLKFCREFNQEPEQSKSNRVSAYYGRNIPHAAQQLIESPDFADKAIAATQPYLAKKSPDILPLLVGKLEELVIVLSEIKLYLKDEPDAILRSVEGLRSLLSNQQSLVQEEYLPDELGISESPKATCLEQNISK